MFCKVFTTGGDNFVYLNPNSNMKLIYEYLRVIADIPESLEVDLCSEGGQLLGIYDAECSASGLTYLKPRANYFMFIFDYRADKPDLFDPRPLMAYNDQDFHQVFGRIKKNFAIPREEYVKYDDAVLIFEHMLKAYEERATDESYNMADLVSKSSRGSNVATITTKKSSRKSIKSDGKSRVLQVWREEKRAKLAEKLAEEPEPVPEVRRKSVMSSIVFPGMELRNALNSIAGEEDVEDEHDRKQSKMKKGASTTKKLKKTDKKKKHGKEDDVVQRAAVPIRANRDRSGASVDAISGLHLLPLKDSNVSGIIKLFPLSRSSSISDFPKPPGKKQEGNRKLKVRKIKKRSHIVSTKLSKLSK